MILLAHGLGGRSDLPIPLWMALYGAAAAVLISFFALAAFWIQPKFKGAEAGRPFPDWVQSLADSTPIRIALKSAGVLFLVATLVAALFGKNDPAHNPAATWFYVWFWVGLVPLSLLLGPIYRVINPLRTISYALHRIAHDDPTSVPTMPKRWGYLPAAISLAAFVWLELVWANPADQFAIASFLIVYCAINIAGGTRYGPTWHERGDGFHVYADLIASFSPVGRSADRTIVLRNPFDGLASIGRRAELVPVVAVILGSTAFDGLTRTRLWASLVGQTPESLLTPVGTLGLALAILFVAETFLFATQLSERSSSKRNDAAGAFVHSLIPIAIGYTIAHYFSLLLFQGQAGYILASDPFSKGWDLFGTDDWRINYLLIGTSTIALVQVAAIVIGHICGVVAAHDRAVEIFPKERARTAQYALLAVMVAYTVGGIAILVGA